MFEKKLRDKNKIYKPLDGKFLNNLSILKSKFIYNIFLKNNLIVPKIPLDIILSEQENIYSDIHKFNKISSVRIVNYKLLFNGLPTNKKFKNRYSQKCYMCDRVCDENTDHIFINCKQTKSFYNHILIKYLSDKKNGK